MDYLVISSSLNPNSRSRILAKNAYNRLVSAGVQVDFLDLADLPLPMCDGANCYDDENAKLLKQRVAAANGILMAVPIYIYDASAVAKNVIELTGRNGWTGKVAGFLCSAGGKNSYMAIMNLANNLMLNFRTVIIPRFVYANYTDFDETRIVNPEIHERLDEITADLIKFTTALASFD